MVTLPPVCLSCRGAGTLANDAPCSVCRGTGSLLPKACAYCSGAGRLLPGVACGVCKGTGSVPAHDVVSESPVPTFTLEDAQRQIRQLQRAIVMLAQPDQPPTLVARRLLVREIETELKNAVR